ncbi:MAG: aminotransferase class V-fold PLP-dependent enzyme [Bacteroidales bacterium]|nr:aminotransferase class V-fold PLP-dependent enzyme [Bacteroidales bacterium]
MINWEEIRDLFPVCKKYVYLNPAGGSPVSYPAAAEGKRFYDEMLAEGDTCWDKWLYRTEEVRRLVAGYINAHPSEIGFTTNASTAMNYIAHMLYKHGEVLTMEGEFPSTTYPWLNLGKKLQFVKTLDTGYPVHHIRKSLNSGIKILVSSHVQYSTGYRQNLEKLGELCASEKLVNVVNATQSMGIFNIDVKKHQIDYLVFTGLKWATAGYGIAGIYISKKFLDKMKLPLAGWRSVENPEQIDNSCLVARKEASAIESGCPHFPNIFALGGALQMFNRIGQPQIEDRVLHLNRYLELRLTEAGMPVIKAFAEENRSGILIVSTRQAERIVKNLARKNIIISARGAGLRISVNIYNNETDIERLVEVLKHENF